MKRHHRGERRGGVRALTLLSALGLLAAAAVPVRAACDGPAPRFDERIAGAERVVIGQVMEVATDDVSSIGFDFTLDVLETVKGAPVERLEVHDLFLHPCAGPFAGNPGDVIAIAFGARDGEFVINPVAYLEGDPSRPDLRHVTVGEVYALAGVTPAAADAPEAPVAPILPIALLSVLVIASGIAVIRRR